MSGIQGKEAVARSSLGLVAAECGALLLLFLLVFAPFLFLVPLRCILLFASKVFAMEARYMASLNDPFNESVSDVRELVAKAENIRESVKVKGLVDRSIILEVRRILDAAHEELELLKDAVHVIEQCNGKVGEQVFSANELVRRQGLVHDLETDVKGIRAFHDNIETRLEEMREKSRDKTLAGDNTSASFLLGQELAQREQSLQQDVILDRLTYGLQELRETGVSINDELQQQELLLDEAHRDMEGVRARLSIVNTKVNKIVAAMSTRDKMCTILCLTLTLVFLAFIVLL